MRFKYVDDLTILELVLFGGLLMEYDLKLLVASDIGRVRPKPNSLAELFGSAIVRLRFRGTELSILKVRLRLRGTELFEKKFLLNRTVRPNI